METSTVTPTICTRDRSNPAQITTEQLAERVIVVAEFISGRRFYPYQKETGMAIVTSVLERDGEIYTALFSRQSGKTEILSSLVAAMAILIPALANLEIFADDYRFNLTDDQGNYRGFKHGISIGIYAPKQDQSDLMFRRVTTKLQSNEATSLMKELGCNFNTFRGTLIRLSNGTQVRSQSASEQAVIEGETYHLLVLEEAQDLGTLKVRKSLHPMASAVKGTIVKIGTCSVQKSDYYHAIRTNIRRQSTLDRGDVRYKHINKLHFFYPHTICELYNSLYKEYVEREKVTLGEESDEFRMAYKCEWLLDRGMFISETALLHPKLIEVAGKWAEFWKGSDRFGTQVAGIDFGKKEDPTVIAVIDVDWENPVFDEYVETMEKQVHYVAYKKHLVALCEIPGDNYEVQFQHITEFLAKFHGLKKIVLDQTGVGEWGHDKFITHYGEFYQGTSVDNTPHYAQIEVEGFNFQSANQSEGFKLLQSDLLAYRLSLPCGDLTRKSRAFGKFLTQMLDLRKEYTPQGYMICRAPDEPDAHDDYPDALMLANWGANAPADSYQIEQGPNFFRK